FPGEQPSDQATGSNALPLVNLPIAAPADTQPTIDLADTAVQRGGERVAARDAAGGFSSPRFNDPEAGVDAGVAGLPDAEVAEGAGAPSAVFGQQALPTPTMTTPAAPRPGDPALEGRQQPTLALQKFAPEEVQIGKPCKFVVKVRNDSPGAIADVVVNDHTPAGTRLISTSPTAETTGDAVRWRLGTLGPGEQRTLEMQVVPTEEGEIGSVATVSFAAQASAKAVCTRPMLALRMTAPAEVLVGDEQRIQIEVRNPGTGAATGVVLVEDVPQNLRHEAGPTLEFEIGTLQAGETRQLELVMNAEEPGAVSNVLVARADGDLQVEQQVDFQVVAPALAVSVNGPTRRFLQRPATYTVRVDNPGTAAARDIRLVTRLPRGMQFVKANNLGEYDASTHSVYWALAELPQGEGGEVSLTAVPTTAGEMNIKAEGKARSGLQDEAEHAVRIEGIAAVAFEVLDVEDPIDVGGKTEYEVRVSNSGTKAAGDVAVRLIAPAGMRVLSASGPAPHTIDGGGVVFEPLDSLEPRDEQVFRVQVQADQAGDQRITVEVKTDDLSQPIRKEEATRVFGND
ncbi:MAG: hypothetical protein AAF596_08720, partial [Planctomycetota bacterium]